MKKLKINYDLLIFSKVFAAPGSLETFNTIRTLRNIVEQNCSRMVHLIRRMSDTITGVCILQSKKYKGQLYHLCIALCVRLLFTFRGGTSKIKIWPTWHEKFGVRRNSRMIVLFSRTSYLGRNSRCQLPSSRSCNDNKYDLSSVSTFQCHRSSRSISCFLCPCSWCLLVVSINIASNSVCNFRNQIPQRQCTRLKQTNERHGTCWRMKRFIDYYVRGVCMSYYRLYGLNITGVHGRELCTGSYEAHPMVGGIDRVNGSR